MKYEEALSKMIACETVSVIGQTDLSKFYNFHELLKELFPNIWAKLEIEDFQGSLLMKWQGKTDADPILLMCHHDVVAAPEEGWSHKPFSGEIADGRIWGRGTMDTKSGLWAMLTAADELAAEGFVPNRTVYFESGCNEETMGQGCDAISQELQRRGIRLHFVIDEGGYIIEEPISGAHGKFAMVGLGEKACVELQFTAKGNGGHASTPEPDTPLVRLGKFMAEADKAEIFDVQVSPTIKEMFRTLAPSMDGAMKHVLGKPDLFGGILKTVMPKTSATAAAMLRTTLAFTMASGSEGRNVIPSEAWVVGNMRCSHHQGVAGSLEAVTKLAAKYGIETIELDRGYESTLSDFNTDAYRFIAGAVETVFPDVKACPYIMTGASDARYMSRVCDNCFRFLPFEIDHQQMESIHGIDENVFVKSLPGAVQFFKYVIKEA